MFQLQKAFSLQEESKTLILTNDLENALVTTIFEGLNLSNDILSNEPFTTVYTLGKLAAKKVIIIEKDFLENTKKTTTVLKAISGLKEDAILLLDSFDEKKISHLFEGLLTIGYTFNKLKSKDDNKQYNLAYFTEKTLDDAIHEGVVYGEAINHTKDLVNLPYNYLNATGLAEYATSLSVIDNLTVKILNKKEIEALNMGAFLGVNKGSKDEPKLIHIDYNGDASSKEITALIGKGVMYDTGGYSLKTPQGMPNMKCDMAGAATVLGSIEAIARLKYKANVSVIIAATDNRIGDDAIVPDDILTAANGLTIEIISTDAEGRLTLADALWYAQKEGATKLIDVATLTGAIVAALGKDYTGAFTNNKNFLEELKKVSEETKEGIWEMPISEGYREELKSYAADMSNKGGRLAGASIAAAFLEKFIENDCPWIHLDIAGTSFESATGATGTMVKTLARLFK
ncbi:leucyl aminopeptidase family protein [Liberiplasma polymorphum]|jgi:leucyl aminopeptidase|uniref:leucyl aminopeptidase family protein n=1 Tax=Liberiplasma polymorphum TaxID=3374570 RepID=UPI00377440B1